MACRDLFERFDDEVGAGLAQTRFGVVPDETDGDAFHAARTSGLHAGNGILEDHATNRSNAEPLGGHKEDLRVRLAALRVLTADHGGEETFDARQPKDQFEIGVRVLDPMAWAKPYWCRSSTSR